MAKSWRRSVGLPICAATACGCSWSVTGCAGWTSGWSWPPEGLRCPCARPTPPCGGFTSLVSAVSFSAASTTGPGSPRTPTRCCRLLDGAVVVRSHDPERQLQGLRAALSLSLGDRRARVFLVGAGVGVLDAAPETEAARCLAPLREPHTPVPA